MVPGSGHDWQRFSITPGESGDIAELRTLQPLDYEDPEQRNGFRFLVQVSDKVCWFSHKSV